MPSQVAILHGWSDTSKSFRNLRDFLTTEGWSARDIWLGDYTSTDDDVRVEDVAKRMQEVVQAGLADGTLTRPFDLIVHSTGGLVAREWLATYYPNGRNCPVKRLIMLAPANFGSRLASLGKSMIGRVFKGWNNWFQSGTQMLLGLELAAPYQWDLARRDLFDLAGDGNTIYGKNRVWPFVIVGTRGFTGGLQAAVNENGADGTVRASAANLNAVGLTVDFSNSTERPTVTPWTRRAGATLFPLAILPDRDHGSIHEPADEDTGAPKEMSQALGRLIIEALACSTDKQYAGIAESWRGVSEQTAELRKDAITLEAFTKDRPTADALHQYMQVVTLVRDDAGVPVNDFFLEFFAPEKSGSKETVYFQKNVLEHVHVNSVSGARRCLYVDRTDLMVGYYDLIAKVEDKVVAVSISAAPPGRNVQFFDSTRVGAKGHLIVHTFDEEAREDLPARLFHNVTHLVEIIIPRRPITKVFGLSQ